MISTTQKPKTPLWSDEPFPLQNQSAQNPFSIPLPRSAQKQVKELQQIVDEMTKTVASLQEQVAYLTQEHQHLRMEMTRKPPLEDRVEVIENLIQTALRAATSGPPPSYEDTMASSSIGQNPS